jgi:hypothetical protein
MLTQFSPAHTLYRQTLHLYDPLQYYLRIHAYISHVVCLPSLLFPTSICSGHLITPMRATCPAHLTFVIPLCGGYELCSPPPLPKRAGWYSGKSPEFCSGGARIESAPGRRLSRLGLLVQPLSASIRHDRLLTIHPAVETLNHAQYGAVSPGSRLPTCRTYAACYLENRN